MRIIYKCDLCKRPLPELDKHDFPFTACDECFEMAGSQSRFIQLVNSRREMEEERAALTAFDLASMKTTGPSSIPMKREDFISMCHNAPIKHERMRDVAFIVMYIDENATHYKLRGQWLNIVAKPQYLMGGEEIEIDKLDAHKWGPYYDKD